MVFPSEANRATEGTPQNDHQLTSHQLTSLGSASTRALDLVGKDVFVSHRPSLTGDKALIDKHTPHLADDKPRVAEPPKRATQTRRRGRNRGGWPISRYLKFDDLRAISEGIHALESQKKGFTHFVTLRPPSEVKGDQSQKLWCRRQI